MQANANIVKKNWAAKDNGRRDGLRPAYRDIIDW